MSFMQKKKTVFILLILLAGSGAAVRAQNPDSVRVLVNGYIQPIRAAIIDTSMATNEKVGMQHFHLFQRYYQQFLNCKRQNGIRCVNGICSS